MTELDGFRSESRLRVSGTERHRAAVKNSLARAQASADIGRFDDALAWLEVVRTVDGPLPEPWDASRRDWEAALLEARAG